MYCPKCGSSVDGKAAFCPYCGMPLKDVPPAYASPDRGSNTCALLGLILSFLVPVIGFILSIVGLHRANSLDGDGRGFAIGGLVVSVIEIVLTALLMTLCFLLIWR